MKRIVTSLVGIASFCVSSAFVAAGTLAPADKEPAASNKDAKTVEGSSSEAASASFACPERPDKVARARKLAGQFFTEAEEFFDNDRYEEALHRFICSMVMVEHPNTVTNIERTLEKVEDKSGALEILKIYSALRPDGEMKAKMDEIIAGVEASIPPAKQEDTAPPCPEVKVVESPPCPKLSDPKLEIEFKDRALKVLRVGGWTASGIGAASFVTAIVFQAVAGSAKNRAQETASYDVFQDERDKNQKFQVAATSLFVAAALAAGVGVAELVLGGEQQRKYKAKKAKEGGGEEGRPSEKPKAAVTFALDRLEVTF